MANYNTMQEAIEAGTTNMGMIWSGSSQYGDWYTFGGDFTFMFNQKIIDCYYIHGGYSYLTLSRNNADTSPYTLGMNYSNWDNKKTKIYTEAGTINGAKFFRIRYEGYNSSWSTSSEYIIKYEVFLFGFLNQMYVRLIQKPDNPYGTWQFQCGNQTFTLLPEISSSITEWTFIPNNIEQGTDWVKKSGAKPRLYILDGESEYSMTFTSQDKEALIWEENIPTDTSIDVYIKYIPNTEYRKINSGYILNQTVKGNQYTLWIKIKLHAADGASASPTIGNLHILTGPERKKIYLNMANTISTANPVDVAYDGLGGLQGFGGAVAAFSEQIT